MGKCRRMEWAQCGTAIRMTSSSFLPDAFEKKSALLSMVGERPVELMFPARV